MRKSPVEARTTAAVVAIRNHLLPHVRGDISPYIPPENICHELLDLHAPNALEGTILKFERVKDMELREWVSLIHEQTWAVPTDSPVANWFRRPARHMQLTATATIGRVLGMVPQSIPKYAQYRNYTITHALADADVMHALIGARTLPQPYRDLEFHRLMGVHPSVPMPYLLQNSCMGALEYTPDEWWTCLNMLLEGDTAGAEAACDASLFHTLTALLEEHKTPN